MTKLIPFNELAQWRDNLSHTELVYLAYDQRKPKLKLVATVGRFDYMEATQVKWLQNAKSLGTHLIVGIYSDEDEDNEPGYDQDGLKRAFVLSALECVDAICVIDCSNVGLETLLSTVRPHVYYAPGLYCDVDFVCRGLGCDIVIGEVK
jgi:bifunctional ADP-heptose synthase (sugar kinase/adenylyltransferase)